MTRPFKTVGSTEERQQAMRADWPVRMAPWSDEFIQGICTPRADGRRCLTPPNDFRKDRVPWLVLAGVAAAALAGVFLWWELG